MSSNAKTIENLQRALSMEMTAVHQYLLHAHVLEDWGLDILGAQMREEMQEELGHAGAFVERILFLKGDPQVKEESTPQKAGSLQEMFRRDLDGEKEAIKFYTDAANAAAAENDIGTRTLFEKIALDEEGHMSWLELQLDLLERIGEPAYTAKYMSSSRGEN